MRLKFRYPSQAVETATNQSTALTAWPPIGTPA
jgi:hypothetical protein